MELVAPHAGCTPGIYQVLTTANTDYSIAIPKFARGILFWFETSTSVTTLVGGRFAVNGSATAIATLTNADNLMGYFPAAVVQSDIAFNQQGTATATLSKVTHVHFASAVAGAVVRGTWLYSA